MIKKPTVMHVELPADCEAWVVVMKKRRASRDLWKDLNEAIPAIPPWPGKQELTKYLQDNGAPIFCDPYLIAQHLDLRQMIADTEQEVFDEMMDEDA